MQFILLSDNDVTFLSFIKKVCFKILERINEHPIEYAWIIFTYRSTLWTELNSLGGHPLYV